MVLPDVELIITRRVDGTTTASMRVELPSHRVDPVRGVPIMLDDAALTALTLSPDVYGAALTAMVFPPTLREAWREARGYADGRGEALRVRITLDGDDTLHSLCWELLHDPIDKQLPLAHSERVRLARFLPTTSYQPIHQANPSELHAVVACANPSWLPRELQAVDVVGEVVRAQQSLGDIRTSVLDGRGDRPATTIPAITAALRDNIHILYLVCHGALIDGQPYLYLEREPGEPAQPVAGSELVQAFTKLPRRPLLVILASCHGAGDSYQMLTAVGPQLARVGVGAVLAMQGNVPMELVAQLTPRLFKELRRDGQIDRALAVARAALPANQPWWLPTLWMAVKDGSLWKDEQDLAPVRKEPPRPTSAFTGRENVLRQVCDALSERRCVLIHGLGGVGKTQLALTAAHDLAKSFPNGQVLLRLRGTKSATDAQEVSTTLLTRLLNSFGVELHSDDEESLLQQCTTLLHKRRVLIIVDDAGAGDYTQVRLLAEILPLTCAILVTSRIALPLNNMELIKLPTMTDDEAVMLLQQLNPQIGDQATELAKLCGNLPLALTISAGNLKFLQSVEEYLEDFRKARLQCLDALGVSPDDPQTSVTVSLRLSYKALPPQTQRIFQQISIFRASFDRTAAKAVLSSDTSIGNILGMLIARNLLEQEQEQEQKPETRYRLHDLVHEFAQQQLDAPPDEDIGGLRRRYADHYTAVAKEIEELFADDRPAALRRFDRERPHIEAAWRYADEIGGEDGDARLVRLGRALSEVLPARVLSTELEKLYERVLQAARTQDDFVAGALDTLAYGAQLRGDFALARSRLTGAGEYTVGKLKAAVDNPKERERQKLRLCVIWNNVAYLALDEENYVEVERFAKRAFEISATIPQFPIEDRLTSQLNYGVGLFNADRLDGERQTEALRIFNELLAAPDLLSENRVSALINCAEIYLVRGQLSEAGHTVADAIAREGDIATSTTLVDLWLVLAKLQLAEGHIDAARATIAEMETKLAAAPDKPSRGAQVRLERFKGRLS